SVRRISRYSVPGSSSGFEGEGFPMSGLYIVQTREEDQERLALPVARGDDLVQTAELSLHPAHLGPWPSRERLGRIALYAIPPRRVVVQTFLHELQISRLHLNVEHTQDAAQRGGVEITVMEKVE